MLNQRDEGGSGGNEPGHEGARPARNVATVAELWGPSSTLLIALDRYFLTTEMTLK